MSTDQNTLQKMDDIVTFQKLIDEYELKRKLALLI